ncbi:MAG: zinc ribbon domain-containing protein [Promethearchaeota archaeon]
MGWGRVVKSGLVGMLLLIPLSYISFRLLNLGESITGDLISDFPAAVTAIVGAFGLDSPIINILAGIVIGLALVFFFPIHWCIMYRPDDIGLILAVTFPWILTCIITSALFARSPREGIYTSLSIGIGYIIVLTIIYLVIATNPIGQAILDGLILGLTDLFYMVAILTAILEGCFVGVVFGAFAGSLRYKPKGVKEKKKKVEVKEEPIETTEMFPREVVEEETISSQVSDFCTNCGAKLTADDLFCTNCGAKR